MNCVVQYRFVVLVSLYAGAVEGVIILVHACMPLFIVDFCDLALQYKSEVVRIPAGISSTKVTAVSSTMVRDLMVLLLRHRKVYGVWVCSVDLV